MELFEVLPKKEVALLGTNNALILKNSLGGIEDMPRIPDGPYVCGST